MTNKFIEIQYDSDNLIEYSYKGNGHCEWVWNMKNTLYDEFGDIAEKDLSHSHDMISFHAKNSSTYENDAIVVVFDRACPKYLLEEFEVDQFKCLNYYAIKYFLNDRKRVLKTYDGNMFNYETPQLPAKSAIGNQFGVGRTHGLEKEYRDIYFFNSNDNMVKSFYGEWVPEIEEPYKNPATKCYGITFIEGENKIVKLKRYLFPFHYEMTNLKCL